VKIAIMFKGLIRPNPQQAAELAREQLDQFRALGHDIRTYLVTWSDQKLSPTEFLDGNRDLFQDAIMLSQPSMERCRQAVARDYYRPEYHHRTGRYPLQNVVNPYFQSKIALEMITKCDDYDYIVNTRLDLKILFGDHLSKWFDPEHYVSPRTPVDWINDWIGIAPTELMRRSWDYGTLADLGRHIETSRIPEHILMQIQAQNGVKVRQGDFTFNQLMSNRFI
jgi:hypothetical protein